uniref:Uncharacterized protein n=1 Tax=Chromera velia CCMP2878 TaxID=1169474 RepID=A0A0G4F169_9ALVE|eukprot:Cvel_14472.t1-p1 / transcript=Cvel_14472.t1 / gene=Cvel_14472 / organism=Chromera_velia_CCMP2878 / gene_product=hypothetical protein / transcript_product=hypothetical protein / location=Cvel_scaffold1031:9162-10246(+) / protein_length=148 / sequence_SO=supercontig / SO=protein_coding / is_pseudo=false
MGDVSALVAATAGEGSSFSSSASGGATAAGGGAGTGGDLHNVLLAEVWRMGILDDTPGLERLWQIPCPDPLRSDMQGTSDRTLDFDPRAAQARCHQKYGEDWVNKRYLKVLKVEKERRSKQNVFVLEEFNPGKAFYCAYCLSKYHYKV